MGPQHPAMNTRFLLTPLMLPWAVMYFSICTGTRGDPLPASGSFALRVVKNVRCCPVLVVKANSKGPYVRSTSAALGESRRDGAQLSTLLQDSAVTARCMLQLLQVLGEAA